MQVALESGGTPSQAEEDSGWYDTQSMGPDWIGRYRIVERVGVGGMGHVYRAEQREPVRRTVAIKLLKRGMDSHEIISRFQAERQALAMMNHPGVAQVLDAGETQDGRPFFVMEYVKGVPIHEYCDEEGLTVLERVGLFMQACDAVQHAHQKGIIHRDLKPSNIMVTVEDGTARVKVIDFGVAKATRQRLTRETLHTQVGVVVGTPEYMSPEQAGRGEGDVDIRSDVYSLGVVLYELLVGALPFDPATLRKMPFVEMIRTLRDEDPPRPTTRLSGLGEELAVVAERRHTDPRTLQRFVRGDLEWVVMKALEKDPARRYGTASEFGDDLKNYIDSVPVSASPPNPFYIARKFASRHRVAVIAGFLVLGTLIASTIVSTTLYLRAEQERAEAEWQSYVANLSVAGIHLSAGKREEGIERLQSCAEPMRDWEWRFLLNQSRSNARSAALESPIQQMFLSEDMGTLYARDEVRTWRANLTTLLGSESSDQAGDLSLTRIALAGAASGRGRPLAMSRDASRIAVLAGPGDRPDARTEGEAGTAILVLDTRTGIVASTVDLGQTTPRYVALDRDGKRMAVYPEVPREAPPERYAIEVFDLVTQEPPVRLVARERTRSRGVEVRTPLAFVGQGDFLLAGGWIGPLAVWDLNQERLVDSSDLEGITSIAVSPNSRYLVAAGVDGSTRVLRVSGLRKGPRLEAHEGSVTAVAFSADSRWVATGGEDGRVRMSATLTGRLLLTLDLSADNSPIEALAFGSDGSLAVSTRSRLQIFRPGDLGAVRTLGALTEPVALAVGPQYYAAAYPDSTVQLWDVESLRPLSSFQAQDNGVLDMDLSADGQWLVTGGGQLGDAEASQAAGERYLTVYMWSTESGERVAAFGGHDQPVTSVDFGPLSQRVASASLDGTVRLWDTRQLTALQTLHVGEAVFAVQWSDDESRLAVGTVGGRTLLYDPETLDLIDELFGAERYDQGSALWLSADGSSIAMGNRSASEGLEGVLWRLPEVEPRLRLKDDAIIGLRSDGGRFLVRSGSSLQVWASDRLQPAYNLTVPEDGVPLSATFSPNGLDLVATTDQRLVIWRALADDASEGTTDVE